MMFKLPRPNLKSTRMRLFMLVLMVMLPALGVLIYGTLSDLQQNLDQRKIESVRVIDHAQNDYDKLLIKARGVFSDLVRNNEMRNPNNCTQVFTTLRFAYERLAPDILNMGLADAQGNIYCAINPVQGNKNIFGNLDFQSAIKTLDLAPGTYQSNPSGGEPQVSISYPVLSYNGKIQTVIFATIGTAWLENWQSEVSLPPGNAVTLFTPDGQGLWRSVSGDQTTGSGLQESLAQWYPPLQNGGRVVEAPDFDGVTRLNVLVPLKNSASLHLGYPVTELYQQAYASLGWKLALLGLVVLLALGTAWIFSERLFLHPLQDLMKVVARVQTGDLSARVSSASGLNELATLAQSFDQMTDSLQQREIERQESEARFRTMFETSAVGIGLMGLDRKIIDANPAMCKMLGFSLEEMIGQEPAMATYPEDYPRAGKLFEELVSGKRSAYFDERRYVRKNGEIFWGRITMSIVRDIHGKPLYLVGMVLDVDEERRTLESLRESEERFRSMFDNAAVGVAVMTLDHHITQVNQAASRLTGYSLEEMMSLNPSLLAVEEDRQLDREMFAELSEGKRDQYTVEKRYQRKDGNIFWGRVNFSSVRSADGRPLYTIGLIEDISEEKRAAERLAAQANEHRRMLEERIAERTEDLNRANVLLREKAAQDAVSAERTRLARDLHDAVTQTLFSSTLIADVLPEIWEMNPSEGRRRLEEIRQLTRGALAEMRTLLVELRPNALVEVPLATLLRQLTEALTGRARISIQLSAEGERKLPADVQVGLYRIAQEALNNVVKHARATQAVVTLRQGETVRLTVADNGTGFDSDAVTPDHLGLKIMRERADAIGARLSMYSEPGDGTQVSVVWQSPTP